MIVVMNCEGWLMMAVYWWLCFIRMMMVIVFGVISLILCCCCWIVSRYYYYYCSSFVTNYYQSHTATVYSSTITLSTYLSTSHVAITINYIYPTVLISTQSSYLIFINILQLSICTCLCVVKWFFLLLGFGVIWRGRCCCLADGVLCWSILLWFMLGINWLFMTATLCY